TRADSDESDFRRMRVHYWLAESLLALGEKKAVDAHLALALRLIREHGYFDFLKVQAREEAAPLVHALARGLEVTTVSAALVEAGAGVEEALLEVLVGARGEIGEAIVSVLGEIGGRAAQEALERLAKRRPTMRAAFRTALRHIGARTARGTAPAGET